MGTSAPPFDAGGARSIVGSIRWSESNHSPTIILTRSDGNVPSFLLASKVRSEGCDFERTDSRTVAFAIYGRPNGPAGLPPFFHFGNIHSVFLALCGDNGTE